MTTNAEQTTMRERIDPMIEVLIKGLVENASHSKSGLRTENAITDALTEAYMASLIPGAGKTSQTSTSFETAMLVTALAPVLAEALAPALAEALTPAIVKALEKIVTAKKQQTEQQQQQQQQQDQYSEQDPNRQDQG
jgi:hypothetical protein